MILRSKEEFIKYIPTAASCEWRDMGTYLESAERRLRDDILGRVLYEELDSNPEHEEFTEALELCRKVVCLDAYHLAIPFLDLVQHANGFGVVSNQNLAPASRERVNRLIEETALQRDAETEVLIDYLEGTPLFHDSWKGSKTYSILSDSLIMTAGELKRLCNWSGSRQDFLKLKPLIILRMYNAIGRWTGRKYMDELVEEQRDNDLTPANSVVLDMLKYALANYIVENTADADSFRDEAITIMDNSIADFPTYADSREYAARHHEPPKNTKDSPIYIMGGI